MRYLARIVAPGLLALLAVISLPACAPQESARPGETSIIDQLGRTVPLKGIPQRIVSLAPGNTEILFALGLGDRVVGVTTYDNYPPEASEKEKVGGFSTPDLEKVVALAPDLIVAAPIHEKEVIPALERHGLTVLSLAPETLDEVIQAIELTGIATGTGEAAQRLAGTMKGKINIISQATANLSRPRVFYIVWHEPLMAAGKNTFIDELITKAGGANIIDNLSQYPTVDLELVLQRNPEILICNSGHGSGGDSPFQWAQSEPRLKDVAARQTGCVYEINADFVNRAGPRIVDGLEQMLRFLHPDIAEKVIQSGG